MKQKILISTNVPFECIAPYENDFEFSMPDGDTGFSYEQILEMLPDFEGYFCVLIAADKPVFDTAKKLKAIANFGVGYDNIDWKYATQLGIPVIYTPTQVTEATAEHAVSLIMSVMRGIPRYDAQMRRKIWISPLFSDMNTMIEGSTLGIIGFGRIGKRVCRKAQGLGMKVIYFDTYRASEELEKEFGVTYKPFEEVLQESDCVTIHLPYTPDNHHLFGAGTFAKMKNSAYFINTARGKLTDEAALCEALKNGVIKGAALDVFETEPNAVYEELLSLDNVVLTPHAGSLTMRSRIGMCNEGLKGLTDAMKGKTPPNTVNPEVFEKKRS